MGLFGGGPQQVRSVTDYPEIPPNSAVGGSPSTFSPTLSRADNAMRKVAIWASVNLIAGLNSSLPCDGFGGSGADRRQIALPRFFDDPDGSGQGLEDWLFQLYYSWLLRGNVYGLILQRDGLGLPTQIALQHPDSVTSFLRDGLVHWRVHGIEVNREDVWHRRVYPVPGRVHGLSPIAQHAVTISQGLAAAQFGLSFFNDGGHPSAILQQESADVIDETKARTVKARFLAATRGQREPVVLGKGWTYKAIQVSPNEAQFLETQDYTAAECARIYGPGVPEVLGYKTGGTLQYSNVEQRGLDLTKFTLDRWIRRTEAVLSRAVMGPGEVVKFNRGALLSTDLLTRYQAHAIALDKKFESKNEVRLLEDRTPVEGGDDMSDPAFQKVGLPALLDAGVVSEAWAADQLGAPSEGLNDVPVRHEKNAVPVNPSAPNGGA